MDIEFIDSDELPLPPEEVRFREVKAEPFPDRGRVRLTIDLTPFQVPPNIEVTVHNPAKENVAQAAIIGAPNSRMSLTLHLRDKGIEETYRFHFSLGYQDVGTVDQTELELVLSQSGQDDSK